MLNPNIYSSSQNFVSPPTSAVMPDNDNGDPTPTEDALGQLFTMPSDLSSVTIEYQSGTGNANATDKAHGNLWTVDDEDELDTYIGGWQIPDSANSWTARTIIIDDAADLAAMAGQRMAIVLFTETDAQAPNEIVFLDDVRLTACSNAAAEPTATPTRPPVVGQNHFLPAVFNPAAPAQPTPTPTATTPPEPPDWIVIASEDFEGEFPQPGWSLGGTNYTWAKRDCRPGNGSFSGWVIGGGPLGSNLLCGAEYPGYLVGASAPPRLSYGPFSLVGASDAQFQFKVWTNIASASGHSLAYCATRNNINFYCRSLNGSTNGWETRTFSLKNISSLGSLLGEPRVWIRFIFSSYQAPYLPEGAYLDDIVLQKKE